MAKRYAVVYSPKTGRILTYNMDTKELVSKLDASTKRTKQHVQLKVKELRAAGHKVTVRKSDSIGAHENFKTEK